ncbi:MAG: OB-fold domain-containing protein [Pseudorhodobacter sp.]|nr:OB-fold domain-containing protein [Rhizobacter sp.]
MDQTHTDPRFDGPGPDAQYRQSLLEGRFELQHCEDCSAARFPPALVCRRCGSARLAWRVSSGVGEVYATTTVRDRAGDYNVAIVELEQGARMMSRIDGIAADAVRMGMPVQAHIVPGDEPFVVFTPSPGAPL